MPKGTVKGWGTAGTDLWVDGEWLVCRLHKGWMVRPIRPIRYWLDRSYNCWQGSKPWFVLRFPIIFPFLSVCIGKGGFYMGCKVYEHDIQNRIRYSLFLGGWPLGEYLTFSFSVRRSR